MNKQRAMPKPAMKIDIDSTLFFAELTVDVQSEDSESVDRFWEDNSNEDKQREGDE